MGDNRRKRRYRDFLRRADYVPASVYQHRERGWRYIPIHPFGDEAELLDKLQLKSIDCYSVDAWWEIGGDATLVQTSILNTFHQNKTGLYATSTNNSDGRLALYASLDEPFITRDIFEAVLFRFAQLGFPSKTFYASCDCNAIRWLGPLKY